MAVLADLPPELLERIISFLADDQSDLWRLSQTSIAVCRLCYPFFIRSFSNLEEDHSDPTSPSLQKIIQSIRATPALAKNIASVEVRSLRLASYIWLFNRMSAIKHFSYVHTFNADLSTKYRLCMDHIIAALRSGASKKPPALETLTISVLDPATSLDWLEQQFWGTPYIPSLEPFKSLHTLTLDQIYLLATIGRYGPPDDDPNDLKVSRALLPPNLKTFTLKKCTDTLAQSLHRLQAVINGCDSLGIVNLHLAVPGRSGARVLSRALLRMFDIPIDQDGNPEGWKLSRKNREERKLSEVPV